MRKTWKRAIFVFAIVLIFLLLWLWSEVTVVQEQASPNAYQLGTVYTGSQVEFSAKFLVSTGKNRLDQLFEGFVKRMPKAWEPRLSKLHPNNFRHPPDQVDLSTLKPVARAPSFVRVTKMTIEQRKAWYHGVPFVTAKLALNTSRPGKFSGKVRVTMAGRTALLPVSIDVIERKPTLPGLLIASSPYQAYSTSEGSDFHEITKVLSSAPFQVDYLNQMPANIDAYRVIFLADEALVRLSEDQVWQLRGFVEQGGRLIFACDAFMGRSVPSANQILTNYGLQMVDKDYGQVGEQITVTNFVSDPLCQGVNRLVFHRPALIEIAPDSTAKAVALSPDQKGAFVAVSRQTNSGEIAVLSSSLWWYWVYQFRTNSDNARLLGNLLDPPPPDRKASPPGH